MHERTPRTELHEWQRLNVTPHVCMPSFMVLRWHDTMVWPCGEMRWYSCPLSSVPVPQPGIIKLALANDASRGGPGGLPVILNLIGKLSPTYEKNSIFSQHWTQHHGNPKDEIDHGSTILPRPILFYREPAAIHAERVTSFPILFAN